MLSEMILRCLSSSPASARMSVTYDLTIPICGHTLSILCTGCMTLFVSPRNMDRKCSHSSTEFMDTANDLMTARMARTPGMDSASSGVAVISSSRHTLTAVSDSRSVSMSRVSSARILVMVLLIPGLRREFPSRIIPES